LSEAVERMWSDAKALKDTLPGCAFEATPPMTTFVLVEVDDPSPGWVPGARAVVRTAMMPSIDHAAKVRLALTPRTAHKSGSGVSGWMGAAFGVDVPDTYPSSVASGAGAFGELLGYARGEVDFEYA